MEQIGLFCFGSKQAILNWAVPWVLHLFLLSAKAEPCWGRRRNTDFFLCSQWLNLTFLCEARSVSPSYIKGTLGPLVPFLIDVIKHLPRSDLSKEAFIFVSPFEGKLYPNGNGKVAGGGWSWSYCFQSQEVERDGCWDSAPFYSVWHPSYPNSAAQSEEGSPHSLFLPLAVDMWWLAASSPSFICLQCDGL